MLLVWTAYGLKVLLRSFAERRGLREAFGIVFVGPGCPNLLQAAALRLRRKCIYNIYIYVGVRDGHRNPVYQGLCEFPFAIVGYDFCDGQQGWQQRCCQTFHINHRNLAGHASVPNGLWFRSCAPGDHGESCESGWDYGAPLWGDRAARRSRVPLHMFIRAAEWVGQGIQMYSSVPSVRRFQGIQRRNEPT